MAIQLADLEALAASARDPEAKAFIAEAVTCYTAGALRPAIVSTWTACVMDIVAKLRELALTGDKAAETKIAKFTEIREKHDLSASLEFERTLLESAATDFELLTPQEKLDLARLQDDRHRCSHPSMSSDTEAYRPSAELVRHHIRVAVEVLLSRPPVQGKAALARLFNEVESPYFPEDTDDAFVALQNGPLGRAKQVLIRNFLVASIKQVTTNASTSDPSRLKRITAAIRATIRLHPAETKAVLCAEVPSLSRNVPDETLHLLLRLAKHVSEVGNQLPIDVVNRLSAYVQNPPKEHIVLATLLGLGVDALRTDAETSIQKWSYPIIGDAVDSAQKVALVTPVLVNRAVELYIQATSWAMANDLAVRAIIPLATALSDGHMKAIAAASRSNGEIKYSNTRPRVLDALGATGVLPTSEWEALLDEGPIGE